MCVWFQNKEILEILLSDVLTKRKSESVLNNERTRPEVVIVSSEITLLDFLLHFIPKLGQT